MKDWASVIFHRSQILKIDPENSGNMMRLANAFEQTGNWTESIRYREIIMEQAPDHRDNLFRIALAYEKNGNGNAAANARDQVKKLRQSS